MLPAFEVDFNEMLDPDTVLFSRTDIAIDRHGQEHQVTEGMQVIVFVDDTPPGSAPDILVARGTVELNKQDGWGKHVKWAVRIDDTGITEASELPA